jgi:hypothetical protein
VKRLVLALAALALVASGCALGEPLPPTDPTEGGITLNANISSSVDGNMDYWFRYGEPGQAAGWEETELERLRIDSRDPVRVSQVLSDLEPDTRYGWQVCAADEEEDPARVVCSKEQRFGTVGDEVLVIAGPPGSGTTVSIIISVRSGPDGENPSGWLQPDGTEGPQYGVTCLRVSGTHVSIGYEQGFLQLDASGSEGSVTFEELAGRDPASCPTPTPAAGDTALSGFFDIEDAP